MYSYHAGTINSWVVIFILPINSALNPILYTLTTSFFREQVELLLCRWQRSSSLMKDRKSLTSTTIYMEPSRHMFYHSKSKLARVSYPDVDARYGWQSRVLTSSSTSSAFHGNWKQYYRKHNRGIVRKIILTQENENAEFLKEKMKKSLFIPIFIFKLPVKRWFIEQLDDSLRPTSLARWRKKASLLMYGTEKKRIIFGLNGTGQLEKSEKEGNQMLITQVEYTVCDIIRSLEIPNGRS